ncbi:MAG: ATP-dependent sacrificial sulfur transferase LarE [bacterium]
MHTLEEKTRALENILRDARQVAIAYSGGVDSSLLVRLAHEVLGSGNVLAVIGESESLTQSSLEAAVTAARNWGVVVRVVHTAEMENPQFVQNPPDRCYHCKRELCGALQREAEAFFGRLPMLADGNQADDAGDFRPGRRAAREAGVRSPLADAEFTKSDVRALSQQFGIPGADRPAEACLASRVPYGTAITAELLARIAAAEQVLQAAGFNGFRVRHHGPVARIEVPPAEIPRLAAMGPALAAKIRAVGYTYVALDLDGYRTGSLNAVLAKEQAQGV